MFAFIAIVIIIFAGAYFRVKFDINYTLPVIRENKELSQLTKIGGGLFLVAITCFFLELQRLAFGLLIILVPFFLYLNFKTYGLAYKKFFKKKDDNK